MRTILLLLMLVTPVMAQSKRDLEANRKENDRKRQEASTINDAMVQGANANAARLAWLKEMEESGAFERHERRGKVHRMHVGKAFLELDDATKVQLAEAVYQLFVVPTHKPTKAEIAKAAQARANARFRSAALQIPVTVPLLIYHDDDMIAKYYFPKNSRVMQLEFEESE